MANYIVFTSVIIFVLLKTSIIALDSFVIPSDKYDLFYGNLQNNDGSLFFPLNLVFITDSMRNVPFFGDFGIFTGLFHEPNIATLFVSPALFLLLARNKRNWVIVFYLLFSILACSVTNFLFLPVCLLLYLEITHRNSKMHVAYISFVILLIIIILLLYVYIVEFLGLDIILKKLDSTNQSNEISTNIVSYMYNPMTFAGSDIFVYAYNENATDIGFINFFFITLSQLLFVYGMIRLFLSHNVKTATTSIMLLYYFLHSFKGGQMQYQFPFYVFILYLEHMTWRSLIEEKSKIY